MATCLAIQTAINQATISELRGRAVLEAKCNSENTEIAIAYLKSAMVFANMTVITTVLAVVSCCHHSATQRHCTSQTHNRGPAKKTA
jgi:hypothetical protein